MHRYCNKKHDQHTNLSFRYLTNHILGKRWRGSYTPVSISYIKKEVLGGVGRLGGGCTLVVTLWTC